MTLSLKAMNIIQQLRQKWQYKNENYSHLVAVSNDLVIGVNNDLPWNLKDDLAHFKNTLPNKIIIMGRKTYESIGRPLPNRINYVISRTLKN